MTRRAVFLDRDGVLNRAFPGPGGGSVPPTSLAELELLPGAADGCALLKRSGFLLLVATNQPDVARGTQSRQTVDAINSALCARLPLDGVFVCYHDDADHCLCRKPEPGLLVEAARSWQIELRASFVVGDRRRDIEAGHRAGCATVLVGASEAAEPIRPDYRAASLLDAAQWITRTADTGRAIS